MDILLKSAEDNNVINKGEKMDIDELIARFYIKNREDLLPAYIRNKYADVIKRGKRAEFILGLRTHPTVLKVNLEMNKSHNIKDIYKASTDDMIIAILSTNGRIYTGKPDYDTRIQAINVEINKAEVEARRKAQQLADEETRRNQELQRKADEAKRAEMEAKRRADEAEAKRRADVEAKRIADEAEAKRKAEEAKKIAAAAAAATSSTSTKPTTTTSSTSTLPKPAMGDVIYVGIAE